MEQQAVIDFYRYPPIGVEDWRYTFATAQVRSLETSMLSRGTFLDMANAEDLAGALELLGGSDYAILSGASGAGEIERMLLEKRAEIRNLFIELMIDEDLVELLRARHDFANMRLAIRRVVTERPIGDDYSDFGSVGADEFEEIFEQEDYGRFPYYLQEAVEAAVLGYYAKKDIRQIDYAIDRYESQYRIRKAVELKSEFLLSLFRTKVDLTNIRTMLRLKLADRDEREFFLPGGFVENDRLIHGLDIGYEALAPLFFATPYHDVVEGGVSYLTAEQSFLRLERVCEEHLTGFLRSTQVLAAGPQPVIAYFLMRETEVRSLRMVLTCKGNGLDTKMILDRLGE
jgi:V/A-type H+-transporting ATPase subunit C